MSSSSNNSWRSLLSVPLRLKLKGWMWTSVGLWAQIFAWQLSQAMLFVLNFWAKFGSEGFDKGGGFHAGKKYSALENMSLYLHSLKYSFTCKAYIQFQLMNEGRRWTGRADIYWGFRGEVCGCLTVWWPTFVYWLFHRLNSRALTNHKQPCRMASFISPCHGVQLNSLWSMYMMWSVGTF